MTQHGSKSTTAGRREFVSGLVACCAIVVAGPARDANGLVGAIRQLLSEHAPYDTAVSLAREIVFGNSDRPMSFRRWSDAELVYRIRSNVESDYRCGRIVSHGSWRIAATEAKALVLMRRLKLP
jgi:hypothetical protein